MLKEYDSLIFVLMAVGLIMTWSIPEPDEYDGTNKLVIALLGIWRVIFIIGGTVAVILFIYMMFTEGAGYEEPRQYNRLGDW